MLCAVCFLTSCLFTNLPISLFIRFIFEKLFRSIQMVSSLVIKTKLFLRNYFVCKLHCRKRKSLNITFVYLESLGDCSFLNTCFHMDTCKVRVFPG